jgi:release factor glutamine methyltransferase
MSRKEFQIVEGRDRKRVTVREALQQGTELLSRMGVESARLDAEVLLGKVLAARREEIYVDAHIPLRADAEALYYSMLQRRARREPIAYITGRREFWSLDFLVTPDVLVPRPETELLVEIGLKWAKSQTSDSRLTILDLGTGSGAIAVSLARELNDVEIWATDLSASALEIAEANAMLHSVREKIHFLQGDLFEPLDGLEAFFDMIVSNPPYVRSDDIRDLPPEVRDWEPGLALDGGLDGLDFYRHIIRQGHIYLKGKGFMAFEIGSDIGEEVSALFARGGCYSEASLYQDCSGKDRVTVARRLATASRLHCRAFTWTGS